MSKEIKITEQNISAKEQAVATLNLGELGTKIGDYTYILTVPVQVDEEGAMGDQFVQVELTVKNQKATKRTAGFNLETAVEAYAETLQERQEKAAEKQAKKEAKLKTEAERKAAKAKVDAEEA